MKVRTVPDVCRFYAQPTSGRWLASCALIAGLLVLIAARAFASEPQNLQRAETELMDFVQTVLKPFWTNTIIREPIFFIEATGSKRPTGKLLFKPSEVLSVASGTRDVTFQSGRDYIVDTENGIVTVPVGSTIPVISLEHMYPLMSSSLPKIARRSGDRTRGIFFDEGSEYHKLQVVVTYRHEPGQWHGPTPRFAGQSLTKTLAKLRSKQPLTLVLCGDSISLGSNASQFTHAPPGCPPFGKLTAQALEAHYGSKITFENLAVDGTTSRDGLLMANEGRIGKILPDLVIIAFGMNDVYRKRDASDFQNNFRGMVERIRADAPQAEFILVSPMLANEERGIPLDRFWQYRDALRELAGPGVALADVTSMWGELLKRKSFYDLTGNGVNHPNDFGHCFYAEILLALLVNAE